MINNDGIRRSDNFKPHNYMYKMIETMLPKAMVDENKKNIRLLEIWAQNDTVRKGWIKVIQKWRTFQSWYVTFKPEAFILNKCKL